MQAPDVTLDTAPDLLTVPEAAALLRISRNAGYEAVRRGELPAIHSGRSVRVPKAALLARIGGGA